ncbi:MAG: hypothetical protein J0H42_20005 [Rhizobiales bacterium]|nr:hypothetical protein [Hyphomicrobiales bacterium]
MRRVFALAAGAGLASLLAGLLAGCSSFSLDSFKPAPQLVPVQLESTPPGADATTSLGPGCKTPCTVSVAAPDAGFSVTFNLPRSQPVTVPVQVIRNPGDFTTPASTVIEPSPVFAELKPAGPPPRAKPMRPKKKKPKAAAAPAAVSAFPDPSAPAPTAQPAR